MVHSLWDKYADYLAETGKLYSLSIIHLTRKVYCNVY
ncbi:hypothetical protein BH10CHL1_BH10CHL1_48010 [soil metagenome]